LSVDPLLRNCIDHLTASEQQALERDLDLAHLVQSRLLPPRNLHFGGWDTAYHYEAAGPVSGDYCDLLVPDDETGSLYFFLGDVSGKGIAASILMSHLHASFRSLVGAGLSVSQLLERVNRLFCEGTISTHYATLVGGRAMESGTIQMANAGHCSSLIVRGSEVVAHPSTGFPLGMFCQGEFRSQDLELARGDSVLIYSDGLPEARNVSSEEYGEERLKDLIAGRSGLPAAELIQACLNDLNRFRAGASKLDDLTILALHRTA
jgi:sigma-B regulation protein RsbU (phosphoserine phosphatase)